MKEQELREHATCSKCRKPIGHTGLPLFWTVKIDRHGVMHDALQRNAGLAMALGSVRLAQVMGPDEELTTPLMQTVDITLCEECAFPMMELIEQCTEQPG